MAAHRTPLTIPERTALIAELGGVDAVCVMTLRALEKALKSRGMGNRTARQLKAWAEATAHFTGAEQAEAPPPVPDRAPIPLAAAPAPPPKLAAAPLLTEELHEPNPPPAGELPLQERLAEHQRRFLRRRASARASHERVFEVGADRPLCVVFLGDPHIDDDGCDWDQVNRWLEVCAQPGVWAVNIGDTTNNWIGRLRELFSKQACTEGEAWERTYHFARGARWLAWLLGNHDHWGAGGFLHKYILQAAGAEVRVIADMDARICLRWPSGEEFRIWARHSFKGGSQWNTLHGPMKAARMNGYRADLYIDGHKHETAYLTEPHPDGRPYTACRVRGFKFMDDYAAKLQFSEGDHGAAVMMVLDPHASPMARCRPVWTPAEALAVLDAMRQRRAA